MKIRMANKNDTQDGIKEIVQAVKEFPEFSIKGLIVTDEYYKNLINLCFDKGMIVVAEENNKIIGCLMGLLNNNIFTAMQELVTIVTWVHKDKRNSSAFYRMHKLYKEEYTKLKQQNKIDRVIMACLPNKTNIKFEKLGYTLAERTYEWR
tara:strand:- start:11324 stop:11773 length:450 start_codon:yes stop_codon:yes gene_type:complete